MTVEEVKKALMECRSPGKCDACPLKDNNDCITLLKWDALNAIEELEERIGIVQESMEALEKRQGDPDRIKVTRCKDCEHATMTTDGRLCKYCELVTDDDGCEKQVYYDANWFCADGKRR